MEPSEEDIDLVTLLYKRLIGMTEQQAKTEGRLIVHPIRTHLDQVSLGIDNEKNQVVFIQLVWKRSLFVGWITEKGFVRQLSP